MIRDAGIFTLWTRPNVSRPYGWTIRRSVISCWRSGILSMDRDSSRTSYGSGLRRATRPSLPTKAIIYPRGLNVVRRSDMFAGSVSVMTSTSRSANRSISAMSRSSCWRKRGSLGIRKNHKWAHHPLQFAQYDFAAIKDGGGRFFPAFQDSLFLCRCGQGDQCGQRDVHQ